MTTLRMRAELRARIEDAANASGRSISQEVEQRLEWSFLEDDYLGGGDQAQFVRWLLAMMDAASQAAGSHWSRDADAFNVVKAATGVLFQHFAPTDSAAIGLLSPSGVAAVEAWVAESQQMGRRVAELVMRKASGDLSADDADELDELLANPVSREPNLPPTELEIWRKASAGEAHRQKIQASVYHLLAAAGTARGRRWP